MLENREQRQQEPNKKVYVVNVYRVTSGQSSVTEVARSTRFKEARGFWKQHRESTSDMLLKHFEEDFYIFEYEDIGEYHCSFIIYDGNKKEIEIQISLETT